MTLEKLEQALKRWTDRTFIGWHTLKNDGELIRLLVNGATRETVLEYLENAYPDYFEEEEAENV